MAWDKQQKIVPEMISTSCVTVPEAPVKPKCCQQSGCKKKLMLTDFACKCKAWYCGAHRFSETHNCSYDYKESSRVLLEQRLNKVAGQKMEYI